MKIAVAVHGRFHGFDLARELAKLGHEVVLFTNYPKSALARFGLKGVATETLPSHGVSARIANRLLPAGTAAWRERRWNTWFGNWAAGRIARQNWDVVAAFSGIALPIFKVVENKPTLKVLQRGSTHIAVQRQLLDQEAARSGVAGDRPSDWIVARESAEYKRADLIQVLSTFAKRSFVESGIPAERMGLLRQGADGGVFSVSDAVAAQRASRIVAGEKLRVLFVGPFSFRKGALDLVEVARSIAGPAFEFRCVGPQPAETAQLRQSSAKAIDFIPKVPREQLAEHYNWADAFIFPTIEDGGAVVLFQALGSGLPILATTNCAAPDIVREGDNGWITPIREPSAMVQKLQWCDRNRQDFANMTLRVAATKESWPWSEIGRQANENIANAWQRRFGQIPAVALPCDDAILGN